MSETMHNTVFAIGHSSHSQEHSLSLLRLDGITALCDVRLKPYSRVNPQFNLIRPESMPSAEITSHNRT
jgi:hypothetical protein